MRLDSQPDAPVAHNCEVCVLRNGKGSRDGIQVPQERPARLVAEEKQEDFPAVVSDFHFTPPEAVSAALNGEKRRDGPPAIAGAEVDADTAATRSAAPKKAGGAGRKTEPNRKIPASRRRGGKSRRAGRPLWPNSLSPSRRKSSSPNPSPAPGIRRLPKEPPPGRAAPQQTQRHRRQRQGGGMTHGKVRRCTASQRF